VYLFKRVVSRIQYKLHLDLSDQGKFLFTLDKQHYADVENELAKKYNNEKEKFQVTGNDGKVWLLIDKSDLDEFEYVHSKRAVSDCDDRVSPFFNDLRENQHYKLSELSMSHKELLETVTNLVQSQEITQTQIQTLIKLITPKELERTEEVDKDLTYFRQYTG
jgi:hypothetical protein